MTIPEWQATISAQSDAGLDILQRPNCCDDSTQEVKTQDAGPITPMPPQETGTAMPTNLPRQGFTWLDSCSNYAGMCDRTMATDKLQCIDGHVLSPVPQHLSSTSTTAPPLLRKGPSAMTSTLINYVSGVHVNGAVCQVTQIHTMTPIAPDAAGLQLARHQMRRNRFTGINVGMVLLALLLL